MLIIKYSFLKIYKQGKMKIKKITCPSHKAVSKVGRLEQPGACLPTPFFPNTHFSPANAAYLWDNSLLQHDILNLKKL